MRVGVDLISDPAFLVTREMEDYVTWVDTSKIKQHIMKYNDKLDDFDLLGEYVCLFCTVRWSVSCVSCCDWIASINALSLDAHIPISPITLFS